MNEFTYASGTTAKLKNVSFSAGNYINWKPANFDALQVDWIITFKDAFTGVNLTAAYSFTKTFTSGNSYTSNPETPAATLNNQVVTLSYTIPFVNSANQKIVEPFVPNNPAAQGPGYVDFNVSLNFGGTKANIVQTEQPSVAVKLTAIKR